MSSIPIRTLSSTILSFKGGIDIVELVLIFFSFLVPLQKRVIYSAKID